MNLFVGVDDRRSLLLLLLFVHLLATREHVDHRILDERAEHEDEAGRHPDVDRLRERHSRHVAQMHRTLRRYRQHCQDAERDAGRHRLQVDPEGHLPAERYSSQGQIKKDTSLQCVTVVNA